MPPARGKKVAPLPVEVLYHANLRAPVLEEVNETPKARVHRVEWSKIMDGQPVEINPSVGSGYKVMTVGEGFTLQEDSQGPQYILSHA